MKKKFSFNKILICLFLILLLTNFSSSILINLKSSKSDISSENNNSKLDNVENLATKNRLRKKSKINFLKFKSTKINTENEDSITFKVVGPNIDSTKDNKGLNYKDNYLPIINQTGFIQGELGAISPKFEYLNKYNKDLNNVKRFIIGNYGKSRITRF